ncbi:MAG: hypothetical protein WBP85_14045 [Terracidiphilus sp.]
MIEGDLERVSKVDYSWRRDNAPPLPKDLCFDDPIPAPIVLAESHPQKHAQKTGFFMVHHRIFSSGFAAQIKPGPFVFYCWLLAEANEQTNKQSKWTFHASDRKTASETGISPTTLAGYRKRLKAMGLIEYSRGKSASYEYTVTDSRALVLEAKPMQEKPRKIGKPRGLSIAKQRKPTEGPYDGLPSVMFERPAKYAVPAKTNFGGNTGKAPQNLRNCAGSS